MADAKLINGYYVKDEYARQQIESLNVDMGLIDEAIEGLESEVEATKKSVSDGKTLLATSITNKRVPTEPTDSFETMANNIDSIVLGSGNAQPNHVLSPYTFTNDSGVEQTGTIPSLAAKTYTPKTTNQTISAGQYLSGAQTIKGDSNLVAGNIASGKSIFGVSGNYKGVATNFPIVCLGSGDNLETDLTVNVPSEYDIDKIGVYAYLSWSTVAVPQITVDKNNRTITLHIPIATNGAILNIESYGIYYVPNCSKVNQYGGKSGDSTTLTITMECNPEDSVVIYGNGVDYIYRSGNQMKNRSYKCAYCIAEFVL